MAKVAFEGVGKVFGTGVTAVEDLTLDIEDGEFLVLVGPSGCGKTTALRMLAGLEDASRGIIRIGERPVNDVPTRQRDIAMVFQNYALYPHMTVRRNMAFSLKLRRAAAGEIVSRVDRAARMLELTELLERLPKQLSGGQSQRVAMGRAIVREPQAFLMDEPLSNLDAKLRIQMRAEISRLQRSLGVTTVYVTHDQIEAMTMSDRVAVMHRGVLQQVAAPQELYDRPVNLFVAGFIGAPPMNIVTARFDLADGVPIFEFGSHRIEAPRSCLQAHPGLAALKGSEVALGIRPEDIGDAPFRGETQGRLRAPVELVESLGAEKLVHLRIDAAGVGTEEGSGQSARSTVFIARCDPRTSIRKGDQAEAALTLDRLHVFDLASGKAV